MLPHETHVAEPDARTQRLQRELVARLNDENKRLREAIDLIASGDLTLKESREVARATRKPAAVFSATPEQGSMDVLEAMRLTVALSSSSQGGEIPSLSHSHLVEMLAAMEAGGFSYGKSCRWLGWAQAAVVANGAADLDTMKMINKRCQRAPEVSTPKEGVCEKTLAEVDWQRIDDALVSCVGLLKALCRDEIGDAAVAELEYVQAALSNSWEAAKPKLGKVRPLDLSNLLKHAFSAGYESVDVGDEWPDYDPEQCPAYHRIVSALSANNGDV